jgi:hypothetical protein
VLTATSLPELRFSRSIYAGLRGSRTAPQGGKFAAVASNGARRIPSHACSATTSRRMHQFYRRRIASAFAVSRGRRQGDVVARAYNFNMHPTDLTTHGRKAGGLPASHLRGCGQPLRRRADAAGPPRHVVHLLVRLRGRAGRRLGAHGLPRRPRGAAHQEGPDRAGRGGDLRCGVRLGDGTAGAHLPDPVRVVERAARCMAAQPPRTSACCTAIRATGAARCSPRCAGCRTSSGSCSGGTPSTSGCSCARTAGTTRTSG